MTVLQWLLSKSIVVCYGAFFARKQKQTLPKCQKLQSPAVVVPQTSINVGTGQIPFVGGVCHNFKQSLTGYKLRTCKPQG